MLEQLTRNYVKILAWKNCFGQLAAKPLQKRGREKTAQEIIFQ